MKTVLIAGLSEILTSALAEVFCGQFEVHIASNGSQTKHLLETLRPDGLILTPALPGANGIDILQRAAYRPPAVILLTNLLSVQTIRAAESAGITCVMRLPCSVAAVAAHLDELLAQQI